ncbi:MAG: tetratricopeptide repeat protein [bacterium]
MTEKSRMELLQEMVDQDPNDDFARYGLALELKKSGHVDGALAQLNELIARHPNYVPAYFMSGQYLAEEDRIEEAKLRLQQGIEVAERVGDRHAHAEMQDYLESLE